MRPLESLRRIGAALFPQTCAGCAEIAADGLCAECVAALPRLVQPCSRCGLEVPVASCPRRAHEWTIAAVIAPFAYAAPLDHYVVALKYRRERALGRTLGELLAAHAAAAPHVDALVPVPLAPRRLRQRGYNQAFEIARAAGAALGTRVIARGIARRESHDTQTGQGAAERHASVRAAFVVTRDLAGQRVAIVDDVITTGATVNALARALAARGAARIDAWAVARTPAPGSATREREARDARARQHRQAPCGPASQPGARNT